MCWAGIRVTLEYRKVNNGSDPLVSGYVKSWSSNYPPDHVRRRRDAAVAGLARGPSQTVFAVVRNALDLSGDAAKGIRCGTVRAADRHHQQCLSFHGAGAIGRDRA